MDITREMLQERLASLEADMNAIGGAIQDARYWLAQLDTEVAPIEEATE